MTAFTRISSYLMVLLFVAFAASTITVPVVEAWNCKGLTATPSEVLPGEEVKLVWDAPYSDISYVTIDKIPGEQFARDGFATAKPTETTEYTAHMHKDGHTDTLKCSVKVTVKEHVKPVCTLEVDKTSVSAGGNVVLTWTTENADSVSFRNIGNVDLDGTRTESVTGNTNFILTATGPGGAVECRKPVVIKQDEPTPPVCPLTPKDGRTIVNFSGKRLVSNGSEESALTAVKSVSLAAGTYDVTLVAWDGYIGRENVSQPNEQWKLMIKDGNTILATTNPTADVPDNVREATVTTLVNENLVIGQAINDLRGVHAVYPDTSSPNSVEPICAALDREPDVVEKPLTCSDVTFNTSDSSVSRGDSVTLSWNWTGRVTSASIDQGIGSVSNNSSRSVNISDDITYTMTIGDAKTTLNCPVSIGVESGGGGGGGGSSSPRCELDISKKKIKSGEEIELTWETSRATRVVIKDNHGKEILDTNEYSSSRRDDYFDGEEKLKPTKDTTYTLTASRGSRDRTCKVSVDVTGDAVSVTETRTQPLVAGISLTEVPYTGFEAGPVLTVIFYTLLTLWALFVAYLLVVRRDRVAGVSLPGAYGHTQFVDASREAAPTASLSPAAAYLGSTAPVVPDNLPVATVSTPAPIVGYQNYVAPATEEEVELSALENRAHAQKALLSSDAMRYLIHTERSLEERAQKLDAIIRVAKVTFPTEDGWIVLNLTRMEALLGDLTPTEEVAVAEDTTPTAAGSLAEAIVTGNVIAAYAMIQNRPMVALADAAADLDAIYRSRKGETVSVSDLLKSSSAALTDEQLANAIASLTTALDGTYSTEEEAVKMAIMKAVKAVS